MGSLTLIFGTVASGKTAEFLRLINKIRYYNNHVIKETERKKLMVFKPTVETRDNNNIIRSRNGESFDQVVAVSDLRVLAGEINFNDPDIIMIDECQFFETGQGNDAEAFVLLINELLKNGKHIALSGLIEDCYGGQFKIFSTLLPSADKIITPYTNCRCGRKALHSQRLQMGYPTPITDPIFLVDDQSNQSLGYSYEPRCDMCWRRPDTPHPNLVMFRQLLQENRELKAELARLQNNPS